MNLEQLYREQGFDPKLASDEFGAIEDKLELRRELLAHRRERRLFEMMESTVFWGTLKAHLATAALGAALWGVLAIWRPWDR